MDFHPEAFGDFVIKAGKLHSCKSGKKPESSIENLLQRKADWATNENTIKTRGCD